VHFHGRRTPGGRRTSPCWSGKPPCRWTSKPSRPRCVISPGARSPGRCPPPRRRRSPRPAPRKVGQRWYRWVTRSLSVVFFHIAPSRGAAVPKPPFATLHKGLVEVVFVCDRYSAYKSLDKDHADMILAFCWAHVRRDFLNAARRWPDLAPWIGLTEYLRLASPNFPVFGNLRQSCHAPLGAPRCM
jgi:Transposase IS66 family